MANSGKRKMPLTSATSAGGVVALNPAGIGLVIRNMTTWLTENHVCL